jgi:hypothetical protein
VDSDVVLLHPQQQEAAELAKAGTGGGDSARSQDSAWAVRTPPAGAEAPAGGSKAAAAVPVLPQLRRVQQQSAAVGAVGQGQPGGMQREGSGNLEWISAVGKEWLNVRAHLPGCSAVCKRCQLCCCWWAPLSDLPSVDSCCADRPPGRHSAAHEHTLILLQVAADPHGRTVMVELAGTAAKEAARGVSAALADRFRMEWLLLAALAMMLLAWLAQRMLGILVG